MNDTLNKQLKRMIPPMKVQPLLAALPELAQRVHEQLGILNTKTNLFTAIAILFIMWQKPLIKHHTLPTLDI